MLFYFATIYYTFRHYNSKISPKRILKEIIEAIFVVVRVKIIIYLISFFCFNLISKGQDYVFENFKIKDGLPSNQVYDIYQDVNGFMWFATDRGICRYNGYAFESFDKNDELTDNTIFKFFPQENGQIWCSTFNNKLFYFNPTDYKFNSFEFNDTLEKISKNAIIRTILYHENELFIGYKNQFGYVHFSKNGKLLSKLVSDSVKNSIEASFNYYSIIEKKGNHYFNYLINDLSMVKSNEFISSMHSTNRWLQKHTEVSIINESNFAFLDVNQVLLRSKNHIFDTIRYKYSPINIEKIDSLFFYISYHGNGFRFYDNDRNLKYHFLDVKSGTCSFRDHEGGIWFSTLNSGLFYLKNLELKQYSIKENTKILNIAKDSLNNLWVSLKGDKSYVFKRQNDKFKNVISIKAGEVDLISYNEDYRKLKWISSISFEFDYEDFSVSRVTGGWRYDVSNQEYVGKTNSKRSFNVIIGVVKDVKRNDNKFIICGLDNVSYFENGKLTSATHPLLKQRIEDIETFGDFEVYSSLGNGLIFQNNDTLYTIDKTDGLNSNSINRTYSEGDSILWVCTNNGLNKVYFDNNEIVIESSSTIENMNITDIEIIRDTIWLSTSSNLYSLPKINFGKSINSKALFLSFKDVKVNQTNNTSLINLDYDENNLLFRFQAISFQKHNKIRYRYKLEPSELKWNYTTELSLSFNELAPGEYKLIIEASIDGSNWEQITSEFNISPPYFQTWWFRIILLSIVLALIYWFFKLRVLIYNKDLVREFIRLLNKKLKSKEKYILIRELGKDIKISTSEILFIKSHDNYIEIYTINKTYLYREKISEFLNFVPDSLEYLRIHRSYIIRIDQVVAKSKNTIVLKGNTELKVTKTYLKELDKIQL